MASTLQQHSKNLKTLTSTGGDVANDRSAQPCGCDEGAGYKAPDCKKHILAGGFLYEVKVFGGVEMARPAVGTDAKWRKERPVYSGVINYFPDAIMEVSHVSFVGNEQHNPGQPLHWAREKSSDQLDAAVRHITDHSKSPLDTDGCYHLAKAAWRILAELQLLKEKA
jgi:hypothetical protein